MNWNVVLMCFAVPFAITAGIAAPILIGTWVERRFIPASHSKEGEQG